MENQLEHCGHGKFHWEAKKPKRKLIDSKKRLKSCYRKLSNLTLKIQISECFKCIYRYKLSLRRLIAIFHDSKRYSEEEKEFCKDAVNNLRESMQDLSDLWEQYDTLVFVDKAIDEDCDIVRRAVLEKITQLYDVTIVEFKMAMQILVNRSLPNDPVTVPFRFIDRKEEYKALCNKWIDALYNFYISMGGDHHEWAGFRIFD